MVHMRISQSTYLPQKQANVFGVVSSNLTPAPASIFVRIWPISAFSDTLFLLMFRLLPRPFTCFLYPKFLETRLPAYLVLSNRKAGHSQRRSTAPGTLRWQHWQIPKGSWIHRTCLLPFWLFCWAAAQATGALLRVLQHLGGERFLACAHLREHSWQLVCRTGFHLLISRWFIKMKLMKESCAI